MTHRHLGLHGVWSHQLQFTVTFVFLQSKVNSARHIAQAVNPVHLFYRKVMCFSAGQCTSTLAAAMQCALRGVLWLPWPARFPNLSLIVHIWDMIKQELTLSLEPATTIAELWQRVQDAWDNLLQDDIQHLYDHLHARIYICIAIKGVHCVLMWLFGHPLLWHVCFIWSEFIIYSYNDKLPGTSGGSWRLVMEGLSFESQLRSKLKLSFSIKQNFEVNTNKNNKKIKCSLYIKMEKLFFSLLCVPCASNQIYLISFNGENSFFLPTHQLSKC